MNTIQLQHILESDRIMKELNPNVLAYDQFSAMTIRKGESYIIICNDQPSEKLGNHWLLIVRDVNSNSVYFIDSLARRPEFYKLEKRLEEMGNKIFMLEFPIQSTNSILCGEFCIFFAFHLARKYSFDSLLKYFSKNDKRWNEQSVLFFIRRVFPCYDSFDMGELWFWKNQLT